MHAQVFLYALTSLILSQTLLSGCTLSNRVEDTKVLCGLKVVNPEIDYVRLLSPGRAPLSESERASTSAEFIHADGRAEALTLTHASCLALPKAEGQLTVRVSSGREWVAYESGLKANREGTVRDLPLAERGRLQVQWACPDQGFLAHESLAPLLAVKDSSDNLQNLKLQIVVSDKSGRSLGTLFSKDFGHQSLELPARVSLQSLAEGDYTLSLNLQDSFFGNSPKALLLSTQCPLQIKRSCASENDVFDAESVSCKPKLCDRKYRVGEFWSEALANGKGQGLFTCKLEAGEPLKQSTDATCEAGYLESRGSCMGATQVAAGLNHSCAVLENGDVSCWGYNVFDTLGPSEAVGSSGKALGPQPPLPLSEAAYKVAVSSVSSCALLKSGRVQCWGFLPKQTDADGFVQYEVSGQPQFVRMAAGHDLQDVHTLLVGGGPDHDTYCAVTIQKEALCWGKDLFSRQQKLEFGHWLYPQRVFADRRIEQLAVTDREICALDTDGAVFCQGSMLGADLFAITAETVAMPIPVPLPAPARSISSQSIGKCALLVDERLYCWGLKTDRMDNLEWNFAHGVPDIPRAMTAPEEVSIFSGNTKEVGLNGEISCVLKADGQPACPPGPSAFETDMSNPSLTLRPPRLVDKEVLKPDGNPLREIETLSVGFWHGCGVHVSGQVYCWGSNQFGRLGNGSVDGSKSRMPQKFNATLIQAP